MVAVQKFLDNGKDVFACNTDISLGFVICHIVYFRFFIVFSMSLVRTKKMPDPSCPTFCLSAYTQRRSCFTPF